VGLPLVTGPSVNAVQCDTGFVESGFAHGYAQFQSSPDFSQRSGKKPSDLA
jgi:hypothetical protein